MEILYGTTNPAKLAAMKKSLGGLDIRLLSLNDMEGEAPEVSEHGDTPLENASEKAIAYYRTFKIPVFSCDSGLFFYNLPEYSPMTHVRNVGGRRLTDGEMIEYYGGLAEKHGDIVAGYRNAVCLIFDEAHIFRDESDRLCGNRFLITAKPHAKRVEGFPLDSLSKRMDSGEYYYDAPEIRSDGVHKGYYEFFSEALESLGQCFP